MNETEQKIKEREHQEDLKRLHDFSTMDDDFMRCLFKDNIPLAEKELYSAPKKFAVHNFGIDDCLNRRGTGIWI